MVFDSSLRRELARSFGATLVVIVTIVLTMMLIRTLGQAAGGQVSPADVLLLMGFTVVGHLPTILNLSLFYAVLATLGRMYRDSEMTIWFASGAGIARFVRPVLRMSWPVLVVVAALSLFAWPWVNGKIGELRANYEGRADIARVAPGQFQSSRDGRRVFFVDRGSEDDRVGRNVFILSAQNGKESVTTARTGHLEPAGDDQFLVLDRGQRNDDDAKTGEKVLSRFERYRVLASGMVRSSDEARPPKVMTTAELLRQPTPRGRGELAWRLGLVLGGANLLLIAIGLAATNPRRASNWNLLFGLLAYVVYFNLINLSQAWVANGRVDLGGALLMLHGSAFALAMALLWWRDHGAVRGLWRRAVEGSPAAGAAA